MKDDVEVIATPVSTLHKWSVKYTIEGNLSEVTYKASRHDCAQYGTVYSCNAGESPTRPLPPPSPARRAERQIEWITLHRAPARRDGNQQPQDTLRRVWAWPGAYARSSSMKGGGGLDVEELNVVVPEFELIELTCMMQLGRRQGRRVWVPRMWDCARESGLLEGRAAEVLCERLSVEGSALQAMAPRFSMHEDARKRLACPSILILHMQLLPISMSHVYLNASLNKSNFVMEESVNFRIAQSVYASRNRSPPPFIEYGIQEIREKGDVWSRGASRKRLTTTVNARSHPHKRGGAASGSSFQCEGQAVLQHETSRGRQYSIPCWIPAWTHSNPPQIPMTGTECGKSSSSARVRPWSWWRSGAVLGLRREWVARTGKQGFLYSPSCPCSISIHSRSKYWPSSSAYSSLDTISSMDSTAEIGDCPGPWHGWSGARATQRGRVLMAVVDVRQKRKAGRMAGEKGSRMRGWAFAICVCAVALCGVQREEDTGPLDVLLIGS
ncbi:hypothetical protein FIBSPDRAFT_895849 [Athelia psychrophila]|uniref:Uncharacterized protein n=1 Tax=Athelia psychrophila TaxID=1759441 RepID=A0A166E4W8_9AGAM|nr:hypothetical protein FIBSPDRAFT_895849 [Fibularhizoctonia sp. CBS 109695]